MVWLLVITMIIYDAKGNTVGAEQRVVHTASERACVSLHTEAKRQAKAVKDLATTISSCIKLELQPNT